MEAHPDDRLIIAGAATAVGILFIAFATITAFDLRYLFNGTLPFIAIGGGLIAYGWCVFNKEDAQGVKRVEKKHHVHVGGNRKERRFNLKKERERGVIACSW